MATCGGRLPTKRRLPRKAAWGAAAWHWHWHWLLAAEWLLVATSTLLTSYCYLDLVGATGYCYLDLVRAMLSGACARCSLAPVLTGSRTWLLCSLSD